MLVWLYRFCEALRTIVLLGLAALFICGSLTMPHPEYVATGWVIAALCIGMWALPIWLYRRY